MNNTTKDLVENIIRLAKALKVTDELYNALSNPADEVGASILDERWELQEQGEYGVVVQEGVKDAAIKFHLWRREIAALPDALRALKSAERCQVISVLKKAGIE